jgi:metallo-beta-lactamase family protein
MINAVLLTHGHLDHTGRLPLLIKYGFTSPVYATPQTFKLAHLILQDAARLQAADAIRQNRKFWKEGMVPAEPLYGVENVDMIGELARHVDYDNAVEIVPGIIARWIEAGHMLGSGSIELTVTENGKQKVIIFSGDLGPLSLPLLRPFGHFNKADLVFLESTYGNRNHKPYEQTISEFEQIIIEVEKKKGKVLVPTLAIGRAQQIIYHLAEMFSSGKVSPFKVFLDSPTAVAAFEVYRDHQDILDEEFQELKRMGVFPLNREIFIPVTTTEQSKALNLEKGPCMILAGAGMCNGGRIVHHLFHNIEDPETHIMIIGYQSYGSLGRRIVDRSPSVTILGQEKKPQAQVHTLNGFSAHADQSDVLNWFSYLAPSQPRVFLIHGEDEQRNSLARAISDQYKINAELPAIGDIIEY